MNGYSMLWLSALYLLGTYLKKYHFNVSHSMREIVGYFGCALITWASKIVIEILTSIIFGAAKNGNYLIQYTSPTIVACSVLLLLYFKDIKFSKLGRNMISFFAPAAFDVYLFHREPLIWDNVIDKAFTVFASYSTLKMVVAILRASATIWLIGSFIDRARIRLFAALRIKHLSEAIENKFVNSKFMTLLIKE